MEIQICIKQTAKIENNLNLNNFCNVDQINADPEENWYQLA